MTGIQLAQRLPVAGVGTNDAPYVTQSSGVYVCPYYQKWRRMLCRCYAPDTAKAIRDYAGVTVCDEWLQSFMAFRAWMEQQPWQGNEIDKDIIRPLNKVYGPDRCCFVPKWLNNVIHPLHAKVRSLPLGAHPQARAGGRAAYKAAIRVKGKQTHLGYYATPEEASEAYIAHKVTLLTKTAWQQTDPRIASGLLLHADRLRHGLVQGA